MIKTMKKSIILSSAAAVIAAALAACSGNAGDEIVIPIYEAESANKFTTVEVQRMDLQESEKTPASIGYACSDALSAPRSGNLVSINVGKYEQIKEGDVIAVIDSSALDYDLRRQQIMADAAYESYLAEGTEAARLNYEYEKALLDEIQYNIDCYTLRAPYDCVISDLPTVSAGVEMEEGTYICSIAPVGEILVYIQVNPSSDTPFKLGTKVNVTLTGKTFEGTVVSVPKSNAYRYELQYSSLKDELGGAELRNMGFANRDFGSSVAADSGKNVLIRFEPEVLAELLEDTPNAVQAGWATVEVVTKKLNGVLAVPSSAIVVTDATYVYLYQDGQRLMTPVTIGDTVNGYTVIINGVSEGDIVVR